jgi:hypothetical protein
MENDTNGNSELLQRQLNDAREKLNDSDRIQQQKQDVRQFLIIETLKLFLFGRKLMS